MSEGVPPDARAKLEALELSERQLGKRAEQAGVSEAELDRADAADNTKAILIELIICAEAAGGGGGGPNIKERLAAGEWKRKESDGWDNWWQEVAMAEQVNRLRSAARIRDLFGGTRADPGEIPDLYPQLVVLGDGNTGKSTVLNRFAEFTFSAVTDGVCTRRPVRLQLRPVAAQNRERMQTENLLAICTMFDEEDQYGEQFTLRQAHREEDEGRLRVAVESRASAKVAQDGTAASFDRQYIRKELIVTIEANQMIYFDLLDLPGLDNASQMPKQMVKDYINRDTLPRTFVLIFAQHKQGDTQLMHR